MKSMVNISILIVTLMSCTIFAAVGLPDQQKASAESSGAEITIAKTSQGSSNPSENFNRLIVMVKCQIADRESFGAGIVVGGDSKTLYIATANHVVRHGMDEAQTVWVQLRWKLGEWKAAVLLDNADVDIDLAVLSLDVSSLGLPVDGLRWDQLGDVSLVKKGDFVYSLGYPNGEAWRSFVTPDRVSQMSLTSILFESNFVGPGNSGGALLNDQREMIGMIRETGKALMIQAVVDTLRQWGYPVGLKGVELSPDPFYLASDPNLVLKSSNVHGNLQMGRVYWQNEVWIDNQRYQHAVGMAAPDNGIAYTDFKVPSGAKYFQTIFGFARDDKSPNSYGNAIGRIYLDDDRVWEGAVSDAKAKDTGAIPVPRGTKRLRLEVDSLGTNWSDQTTWGDPHFSAAR